MRFAFLNRIPANPDIAIFAWQGFYDEVRRAERGIKPNGKINRIPFGFIANFLLFAEGKTSKFPVKESDNQLSL